MPANSDDSRLSSDGIIQLFDRPDAGSILGTFVQPLFALCSRPKAPSDVISAAFVRLLSPISA